MNMDNSTNADNGFSLVEEIAFSMLSTVAENHVDQRLFQNRPVMRFRFNAEMDNVSCLFNISACFHCRTRQSGNYHFDRRFKVECGCIDTFYWRGESDFKSHAAIAWQQICRNILVGRWDVTVYPQLSD